MKKGREGKGAGNEGRAAGGKEMKSFRSVGQSDGRTTTPSTAQKPSRRNKHPEQYLHHARQGNNSQLPKTSSK